MMRYLVVVGVLGLAGPARAGLHLSVEPQNPLPVKWRGFLTDHRSLRLLAVPGASSLLHDTYSDALNKLESAARLRPLTADELADLGGLYVRFGKPDKAVERLRPAVRTYPEHFRLAANLGTAWQLLGELDAAGAALDDAVRLAPERWKPFEQAHRKLVRLRALERKAVADAPDAVLPTPYPPEATELAQQLAVWLPADARLLWLLGEVAFATGDVRTAANILDGCVTEFAIKSEAVRRQRPVWRNAADALETRDHTAVKSSVVFRSARVLAKPFDESKLPTINRAGPTEMPWPALGETVLGKRFPPTHLKFVNQLDGRPVSLVGFIRPPGTDAAVSAFLLTEYPVGCWFCDLPEPTGLVFVEMAAGQTADVVKTPIKVTGTFRINRTDPEAYLFTVVEARVSGAD